MRQPASRSRFKRRAICSILAIASAALLLVFLGIPIWPFPLPDDGFKSATAVRIYDIDGRLSYTATDFAREQPAVELDAAQFRALVANAEYKYREPRWKGSSLAVVTLEDGTEQHLAVSYYGGFFKVVGSPGYWHFPEGGGRAMHDAFMNIIQDVFIPARTTRAP